MVRPNHLNFSTQRRGVIHADAAGKLLVGEEHFDRILFAVGEALHQPVLDKLDGLPTPRLPDEVDVLAGAILGQDGDGLLETFERGGSGIKRRS